MTPSQPFDLTAARDLVGRIPGDTTPGPWARIGWKPCGIYGPGDLPDAQRIARMDDRMEHDDNARLIALSPDLATTLKAALAEIERLTGRLQSIAGNTCCDGCQEAALVARSALGPALQPNEAMFNLEDERVFSASVDPHHGS